MSFSIRQATPEDAKSLVVLINELATYEQLSHESQPDVEALQKHLAPDAQPRCEALVAVAADSGAIVGMALYFYNYSTFLTRWGIFLEDLFVKPAYRGQGIGFGLLQALAQRAVEKGCKRLDWNVLDWNDLALDFYHQLGAEPMSDWTTMRLTGNALQRLGSSKEEL